MHCIEPGGHNYVLEDVDKVPEAMTSFLEHAQKALQRCSVIEATIMDLCGGETNFPISIGRRPPSSSHPISSSSAGSGGIARQRLKHQHPRSLGCTDSLRQQPTRSRGCTDSLRQQPTRSRGCTESFQPQLPGSHSSMESLSQQCPRSQSSLTDVCNTLSSSSVVQYPIYIQEVRRTEHS